MALRFTIDGTDDLEQRLSHLCDQVLDGVLGVTGRHRLKALVLGGGYGRGQGGVLRTSTGDDPYNDLEFYVFLRGNRLLNARRFHAALDAFGDKLSSAAQLHVEFKIESLERLRRSPISMFSYDLVAGHRTVFGGPKVFYRCDHHLLPETIPLSEATRLLFNRCTGLLLSREMLLPPGPDENHVHPGFGPNRSTRRESLDEEKLDFVGRNIAKAQLALGDSLLTANRLYHWDVRERHRRLCDLPEPGLQSLRQIVVHHAAGMEFKLHPIRARSPIEVLRAKHQEVALLARDLWFWTESRRLNHSFASPRDYADSTITKWDSPGWLNYVLNLRTFGMKAAFDPAAGRYPRERLLAALPVLLWEDTDRSAENLQALLHARAPDWRNLVAAYKAVWPSYG
jgi:hypothetical protein